MNAICVFCGSRDGADPAYVAAARETGDAIARRGWTLIYGGGRVGLMGALANAALAADGEVIGVMPRALLTREVAHPGLTRLHLVTSMHRRKALMSSLSDGFLTLPGGYGTLEEFFETLTWEQLGLHTKPCALLDVKEFWQPLLEMIDTQIAQGFVPGVHRDLILTGDRPNELLDRMASHVPFQSSRAPGTFPANGPPLHGDLAPDVTTDIARPGRSAHVES